MLTVAPKGWREMKKGQGAGVSWRLFSCLVTSLAGREDREGRKGRDCGREGRE